MTRTSLFPLATAGIVLLAGATSAVADCAGELDEFRAEYTQPAEDTAAADTDMEGGQPTEPGEAAGEAMEPTPDDPVLEAISRAEDAASTGNEEACMAALEEARSLAER